MGSVGIHIALSPVSRGKSNCAKVAIAMAGNYPKGCAIHLTDSMARAYLGGAVPFVYDDPSDDKVLKTVLMNAFGGAGMMTQRQQHPSRCSPIVTANEDVIGDLKKADRRYLLSRKRMSQLVVYFSTVVLYVLPIQVPRTCSSGPLCL